MTRLFILCSCMWLVSCIDLYRSPQINHTASNSHGQVMALYTPAVSRALKPLFFLKGVSFPPKKLVYVAIKDEKILEVWAKDTGKYRYITAFPILRQSGTLGHKLRQGDKQVPEGIYSLSKLKPDSQYHMGVKIDYPNKLDKVFARHDKRQGLGGQIYIHGAMQSEGCLSMGNRVAEQIYVLTALTGLANSKIIISPTDFRKHTLSQHPDQSVWQNILYGHIGRTMAQLNHYGNHRPKPLIPYKRFVVHGETSVYNPKAPRVIAKAPKPVRITKSRPSAHAAKTPASLTRVATDSSARTTHTPAPQAAKAHPPTQQPVARPTTSPATRPATRTRPVYRGDLGL